MDSRATTFVAYQEAAATTAIYPTMLGVIEKYLQSLALGATGTSLVAKLARELAEVRETMDKDSIGLKEGPGLYYTALGLCGEAGEFANKVKKVFRDNGGRTTPDARSAMADELGDILWYLAACCHELGLPMQEIAERNLVKLFTRKEQGKIHGSGDNR